MPNYGNTDLLPTTEWTTPRHTLPHIAIESRFTFFTYLSVFGCWVQLDIMQCLNVSGIDHIYQRPIGILFPTQYPTILLWAVNTLDVVYLHDNWVTIRKVTEN